MTISITGGVQLTGGISIETSSGSTPSNLVLSLDAAGYTSGPWVDSVGSRSFTLNGGVTYSSSGGGSLVFDPAAGQYAVCASSLPDLNNWTVEVWHYYTANLTGSAPCIVTETYPGSTGRINFNLGTTTARASLNNGFFDGNWRSTQSYILPANNWYQIVGTYDGSSIKLYVNNSLIYSTSYSGTPTSSGGGIRLMRRWDNPDYWGGSLGIVKIYNDDIGQAGVTTSWNANKTRFGL